MKSGMFLSEGVTGGGGGATANLGQLPLAPKGCDLDTSNLACSISMQYALIICSKPAAVLQQACRSSAALFQLTQRFQIWYVPSVGDSAAPLQQGSNRSAASLQQD